MGSKAFFGFCLALILLSLWTGILIGTTHKRGEDLLKMEKSFCKKDIEKLEVYLWREKGQNDEERFHCLPK